jgi:hypothetical protein
MVTTLGEFFLLILGEFLTIERLFSLGWLLKIAEVAQNFELLISTEKRNVLFFKWVWLHLGLFFHKVIKPPWLRIQKPGFTMS